MIERRNGGKGCQACRDRVYRSCALYSLLVVVFVLSFAVPEHVERVLSIAERGLRTFFSSFKGR